MRDLADLELALDLKQVRFVARRESDGVAARWFGSTRRRVDRLGEREAEREISSDDDVVPELFRLAARS